MSIDGNDHEITVRGGVAAGRAESGGERLPRRPTRDGRAATAARQDLIAFSGHVGLTISGGANFARGVHTWNLARGRGGVGIRLNASQARLEGGYGDWNDIVVASGATILDSFLLCGARIVVVAPPTAAVSSLFVSGAQYIGAYCHMEGYPTVEVNGTVLHATDVTVVGALVDAGIRPVSTRATLSATSAVPTSAFTLNFTSSLVFDPDAVPLTVTAIGAVFDGPPPRYAALRPAAGVVTVALDAPASGTVTVTVDQSARTNGVY